MKRFTIFAALVLAMLFVLPLAVEAKRYTLITLVSKDTLSGVEACTLITTAHNVCSDSTHWQIGIVTDQANDSVDIAINAYWSADSVYWTDAQAVAANHQVDDWVMTTYYAEPISRFMKYLKIIATGVTDKNGASTSFYTYIIYRLE